MSVITLTRYPMRGAAPGSKPGGASYTESSRRVTPPSFRVLKAHDEMISSRHPLPISPLARSDSKRVGP